MAASLTPVAGSVREVAELLRPWVEHGGEPLVMTTSGSTGEPKPIRLSHAAVLASAHAALERLGGPAQWLSALPPTGVGGLQVLVRSIVAGTEPVVLAEHPDLESAVAAMTGARRYASLVPTQLFRLVEAGRADVLAGLDAVLLGGAAAPRAVLERAAAAGVRIVRTYGMTETCGGCVYDGVPLDGVRLRIEDDGRVAISGPVLAEGMGEWLVTNDLGRLDADGRLSVLGRADQVAVSGGVNVPLATVETVLRDEPGVLDVVVVAQPDAEWGQRVVAFVVGDFDRDRAGAALECAGHPRTWTPRAVHRLDALPLLPNGKPDRRALAGESDGPIRAR
ncbi:putative O-succinylbenzoic acid--CoA ligase MenE [Aeromicrobium flavum]|uniref:Putative O-succinylbenzoic acid--CoA ligase MenE n=1 Tax=Aeromicrobium flavum TaxID=416568 RepID=A0A512HSR3_9ACTN|nr:AMP-binding protein [Aeromicrobium flavum]GEO88430.1 putative O-succinylbenzoic acid--CoA ligase MenE [Aeromicrobium flavum]